MNLGKNIKKYRLMAGYSVNELARKANVAMSIIWHLEKNQSESINLKTAIKLAKTFNVTLGKLCGLEKEEMKLPKRILNKFSILDELNNKDLEIILTMAKHLHAKMK